MTTKITKEYLKETIEKILAQRISEEQKQQKTAGPSGAVFLSDAEKAKVQKIGEEKGLAQAKIELRRIFKSRNNNRRPDNESSLVAQALRKLDTGKFKKTMVAPVKKESVNVDIEKSELEENEEIEEKITTKELAAAAGDPDRVEPEDFPAAFAKNEEISIQTPEQENSLYEQRFTPKNNRLFEKLVKEWTK